MLWWLELEEEEVAASPKPQVNVGPSDNEAVSAAASQTNHGSREARLKYILKSLESVNLGEFESGTRKNGQKMNWTWTK